MQLQGSGAVFEAAACHAGGPQIQVGAGLGEHQLQQLQPSGKG